MERPEKKKRRVTLIRDHSKEYLSNLTVEFDQFGRAIGSNRFKFTSYRGVTTRKMISILIDSWDLVDQCDKDQLWLNIKNHWHIRDDDHKAQVFRDCNTHWKAYKSELLKLWDNGVNPVKKYPYLDKAMWKNFLVLKSTEEFENIWKDKKAFSSEELEERVKTWMRTFGDKVKPFCKAYNESTTKGKERLEVTKGKERLEVTKRKERCDSQAGHHVTELDISSFGLVGEISHSLVNLTYLNRLDLCYNRFHGTIPTFIGSLTELTDLCLSHNSFHGTIPRSIGSLTELRYLDLSDNSLYGIIPSEFGNLTKLHMLYLRDLGSCRLENVEWLVHLSHVQQLEMDGISLAKENHWVDVILSLQKLTHLSLLGCELSHVIFPDFLNNLSGCTLRTLAELEASHSHFTGPLSDMIEKFSSLERLSLSSNQLNGTINEKLFELPNLLDIDLSQNSFEGRPFLDHMSNLSYVEYLNVSSAKLGRCFPKWIQTLKNLTRLDIANTRISDTIPLGGKIPDLSSNFDYNSVIDLRSNNFSGLIPNVSSTVQSLNLSKNKFYGGIFFLCQIKDGYLRFIDLSDNFLTGQLPDCLWHFKELKIINLGNNNLSGRLPPAVGCLIKLEALYLYKKKFSGELPLSLRSCTSLTSLNLGANKFSGNVPDWIGENLWGLYVLILSSNNFFGTIPLQLCQLPNLHILDLSRNHLHGTIPSCLNNLMSMVQGGFSATQIGHFFYSISHFWHGSTSYFDHAVIEWQGVEREFIRFNLGLLKTIDLSRNNLTGTIPLELTRLLELVALNLSKNTLLGEIPWKIGQMGNLSVLDLSRNNLSGGIPSSVSQMNYLDYLDVSYNNLSGRIPTSTQLQSFEPSRYDGNPGLCGPPINKKCHGDEELEEPPVVVGRNEGDAEGVDEVWGWFYIGVGTGFVTGFWIVCGVLLLNHRGRHAFSTFFDGFKDWVYVKVVVFVANLQKVRQT
ncbi:unnamed protein product [Lactuca saligna]|uniref:Disease resistance R13L4/SHOC-2-like LRR domain-containing protein n=1 Tax=Lactuca saligna TaxID=75948 RepID=A0AA36EBS9_LACSI|nr:unnamed protein product [Lactuca saligna]